MLLGEMLTARRRHKPHCPAGSAVRLHHPVTAAAAA